MPSVISYNKFFLITPCRVSQNVDNLDDDTDNIPTIPDLEDAGNAELDISQQVFTRVL